MEEVNAFTGTNGRKVISTFSGCGGSSLGYKLAGFKVVAALEFIPEAVETYLANAPDTPVLQKDVREVSGLDLMHLAGVRRGDIDILDGSPPCSGFSFSGRREDTWRDEKTYSGATTQRVDDLFFQFIRLVDEINPKVFIAENVPGIAFGAAQGYFRDFYAALQKAGDGYEVRAQIIEGDKLGLPQKRRRMIFQGVRKDLGLVPCFPKNLGIVTPLRNALADIPSPPFTEENDGTCQWVREGTRTRTAWDRTDISVGNGCMVHTYKKVFGKTARYNWFRCNPGQPIPTITAKTACLLHWSEPRSFTIPEIKRLQGFPDDFIATGTFSQQWERIGRAVPPILMGTVANEVAKGIFGFTDKTLVDSYYERLLTP